MPRRLLFHHRAIVAVYGLLFSTASVCLWLIEQEPGQRTQVDGVWPYVFGIGGALSLAAAFVRSRQIAAWSCALMVGSCVSRAWALLIGGFGGTSNGLTDARAVLGWTTWLGYGLALSIIWTNVVMPASDGRAGSD